MDERVTFEDFEMAITLLTMERMFERGYEDAANEMVVEFNKMLSDRIGEEVEFDIIELLGFAENIKEDAKIKLENM